MNDIKNSHCNRRMNRLLKKEPANDDISIISDDDEVSATPESDFVAISDDEIAKKRRVLHGSRHRRG